MKRLAFKDQFINQRDWIRVILADNEWHLISELVYGEIGNSISPQIAIQRLLRQGTKLSHPDNFSYYVDLGKRNVIRQIVCKTKDFESRGRGWSTEIRWKGPTEHTKLSPTTAEAVKQKSKNRGKNVGIQLKSPGA